MKIIDSAIAEHPFEHGLPSLAHREGSQSGNIEGLPWKQKEICISAEMQPL